MPTTRVISGAKERVAEAARVKPSRSWWPQNYAHEGKNEDRRARHR